MPTAIPTAKLDSFYSAVTGLGIQGKDKATSLRFGIQCEEWLDQNQLSLFYAGDGISANAVDVLPEEALDKGIVLTIKDRPDVSTAVKDVLKQHNVLEKLTTRGKLARLWGGAAIVIGANDGKDSSEPLLFENVRDLKWLHVMSRYQLQRKDVDRNPNSPTFGGAVAWTLAGPNIAPGATQTILHPSRVLPSYGVWLPEEVSQIVNTEGLGWGSSVLQRAHLPIKNLVSTYGNIATLIQEYHQAVFQIDDLLGLLAQGEDGVKLLQARLAMIQYGRSVINAMILDKSETFQTQTVDLRGLADIVGSYVYHVAAVTRTPVTKLMGKAPDGMNSTGEGDAQNWDRTVGSYQENVLRRDLEYIIRLIMAAKTGPTRGEVLPFTLTFPPLREMTATETTAMRKSQAETDQIYVMNEVVTPQEIRESRFGGGEYTLETTISEASLDPEVGSEGIDTPESETQVPVDVGVQQQVLNGAQIASLVDVAARVSANEIAAQAAIEILVLSFPTVNRGAIERLVNASVKEQKDPAVAPATNTPSAP